MDALYVYGVAISTALGFPDLFITFTCIPKWLEIRKCLIKDNLKLQDMPDIVTRFFKSTFDELLKELKKSLGKSFMITSRQVYR